VSQSPFEIARKMMVDCQIRPSKVTSKNVIDAFLTVPREAFVGKHQQAFAYIDEDLPLPNGTKFNGAYGSGTACSGA
jgi:protein-L-isoaspartate(D-aspartate) O-methyltransferase